MLELVFLKNMPKVKATCAIITDKNLNFLLIKRARNPFKGKWALVSGIGETKKKLKPKMAIINEVKGDLGVKFKGRQLFSLPVFNDKFVDGIEVFIGKIQKGKIKPNPKYVQGYKWVSSEELKKNFDQLAFEHKEILERFFNGKRASTFLFRTKGRN